jgi:hypothetical protein
MLLPHPLSLQGGAPVMRSTAGCRLESDPSPATFDRERCPNHAGPTTQIGAVDAHPALTSAQGATGQKLPELLPFLYAPARV